MLSILRKTLRGKGQTGFTLIEILIVIAIIAILAAIVIVAINPGRQFKQANNSARWSHVNTVLDSVHQYMVDNSGVPPASLPTIATEICKTGAASCVGLIDLSVLSNGERYLISLPQDPLPIANRNAGANNVNGTGYSIYKTAFDRIIVHASSTELRTETPPYNNGEIITVRR